MEGGDEGGKNGRSGGSAGRKEDPGNNTPSKKGEIDRSLDELSGVIDDMLDEQSDGRGGAAQGSGAGERASEAGNRPEQDQRSGDQGGIRAEGARSIPQGAGSGAGAEMATKAAQGVAGHFQEAGAAEEGRRQGAEGAEEEGRRQGAEGAEEGRDSEAGAQQGGAEGDRSAGPDPIPNPVIESILGPSEIDAYDGGVGGGRGAGGEHGERGRMYAYEEFIDERILISRDAFGKKEMKIKVLEVSDEKAPTSWKLGDRVKVNKILVTVKHLETQQVEEGELDIEAVEKEIARKRHYSSTNRWVPTADIKNGYVAGSRHTSLISDAVALDYITF